MCRILPIYKSYHYFDAQDQLQTKDLNVIEWLLRRVFGCFKETHLDEVRRNAIRVSLQGRCTVEPQMTKLDHLFKWLREHREIRNREIFNGKPAAAEYMFSPLTKVEIHADYNAVQEGINEMRFYIQLTDKNRAQSKLIHILFESQNDDIILANIKRYDYNFGGKNPFNVRYSDSIPDELNSDMIKALSQILAKIDWDSKDKLMQLPLIDYRHSKNYFPYVPDDLNPDALNQQQQKAMEALGWKFVKNQDECNFYTPNYAQVQLPGCSQNQKLSLDFALNLLGMSKAEQVQQ